jgi:hypothetical protein
MARADIESGEYENADDDDDVNQLGEPVIVSALTLPDYPRKPFAVSEEGFTDVRGF